MIELSNTRTSRRRYGASHSTSGRAATPLSKGSRIFVLSRLSASPSYQKVKCALLDIEKSTSSVTMRRLWLSSTTSLVSPSISRVGIRRCSSGISSAPLTGWVVASAVNSTWRCVVLALTASARVCPPRAWRDRWLTTKRVGTEITGTWTRTPTVTYDLWVLWWLNRKCCMGTKKKKKKKKKGRQRDVHVHRRCWPSTCTM